MKPNQWCVCVCECVILPTLTSFTPAAQSVPVPPCLYLICQAEGLFCLSALGILMSVSVLLDVPSLLLQRTEHTVMTFRWLLTSGVGWPVLAVRCSMCVCLCLYLMEPLYQCFCYYVCVLKQIFSILLQGTNIPVFPCFKGNWFWWLQLHLWKSCMRSFRLQRKLPKVL